MIILVIANALTISCADGVAVVDQEEYAVKHHQTVVWQADFPFVLSFDSSGNEHLESAPEVATPTTPATGNRHDAAQRHQRQLPATRLRVGRNVYSIRTDQCFGDPVIIVER
ncbi:hypothetical protein [Permianibacter aggregans]|uniref:Uncharacterized protein n=1 Tax=Permianibacter aggregans TaxID=1510150 RepID=A0A4R6US64_9GAMM|nr:hypothetical protein [Permianibacter aggregans]QGX40099.1 hypothetical protein E2H98_10635 [Permianibacter aggregans]TDQ49086.1 hypothetical protein EV696_10560 [Permianibacter aggregans]